EFTFVSMADNRGLTTPHDEKDLPKAFHDILGLVISKKPSFVLHAGDIFHAQWGVLGKLYNNFKQATDALTANTPFLISPGNHEMYLVGTVPAGVDPLAVFNEQFAQPTGPDPLNLITDHYPGSVFSFDWGNSHFVSIDNCRYDPTKPDSGMYQVSDAELLWLENDLKNAQSRGVRHIFVMAHANAFVAPGTEAVGMALYPSERDRLWQILVNYNVDAYITGHMHIFNDEWGQKSGTKWDNSNVVHWMNGDSGSVFDSSGNPVPGQNHWTLWIVKGDTVTAELYNDLGIKVYSRIIQSTQPR
ncbi:MAG: metallophosphoesterase, partial [Anaerolineales bacterium]|nr:metallophosphoesterase [Anaerolineales bacterium]